MSIDAVPPAGYAVQDQLRTIARLLREVHPLSADFQLLLAGLLDELAEALSDGAAPERLAHLTETTAHLATAVHEEKERHRLPHLVGRFERAVIGVESNHPTLAGLGHRLIEALSNLGI